MRHALQTYLSLSLILSLGLTACGKKEREPVAEQELLARCQAAVATATISLVNSNAVKDVPNDTISTTLQPYTPKALPEDCVAEVSVSFSNALTGEVTETTTFLGLERYRHESDLVSTACVHTPGMPLSPEDSAACWGAQQPKEVMVTDANGQLRRIIIRHSTDGNQFTSPDSAATSVDFAGRIKTDFPDLIFVPLDLGTLSSPLVDPTAFFSKFDNEVPVYVPPPPPVAVEPPASIVESSQDQALSAPELPPPPESVFVPEAASADLVMVVPQGQVRKIMRVNAATTPNVWANNLGLRADALRVEEIFDIPQEEKKTARWLRWINFWRDKQYEEPINSEEITIRGGGSPVHFKIISSFERNGKIYYACMLDATRTDQEQMTPTEGDIIFDVYYIEGSEFDHVSVLDQDGQVIPSASQVLNTFHLWQTEKPFSEKGRAVVFPRQYVPKMLKQNLYTTAQLDTALARIAPYQQTVPGYLVDDQGSLHPVEVPLGITMTDDHSLGWGLDGTWPGNGGSNIHFLAYLPFGPLSLNAAISNETAVKFYAEIKNITGQEQPLVVNLIVNTSDIMILDLETPLTK